MLQSCQDSAIAVIEHVSIFPTKVSPTVTSSFIRKTVRRKLMLEFKLKYVIFTKYKMWGG